MESSSLCTASIVPFCIAGTARAWARAGPPCRARSSSRRWRSVERVDRRLHHVLRQRAAGIGLQSPPDGGLRLGDHAGALTAVAAAAAPRPAVFRKSRLFIVHSSRSVRERPFENGAAGSVPRHGCGRRVRRSGRPGSDAGSIAFVYPGLADEHRFLRDVPERPARAGLDRGDPVHRLHAVRDAPEDRVPPSWGVGALWFRKSLSATLMKNWAVAEWGSEVRAMAIVPRSFLPPRSASLRTGGRVRSCWNSSLKPRPGS